MRKQLYKEHRKMFCKVISVLLILSIIIFGFFFYLICNAEKAKLLNNSENNLEALILYCSNDDLTDKTTAEFIINSKRAKNSEIIITDNSGNNLIKSENKLALNFYDNNYEEILGFIDYEEFKSSITDNQYKKIADLLKSKSDGISNYLLLLTEFYISPDGKDILPKNVKVIPSVLKNNENPSENTVEEFKLKPNIPKGYELRKSADKCDNIISTDFFCGGYASDSLIETVQDNNIVRTDMFTYIFHSQAKVNDNISVTYAEQINILDECYERILIMIIYIGVLLIISTPLIWVISRRSVKCQLNIEQERKDYTSALAHSIKTPLFVISGNAETLIELSNSSRQKEIANNILECSDHANNLVENMLELSKLDYENNVFVKEEINLNELISFLIKRYTQNITLVCKENIIINANKSLIEKVLTNLIDNAIKHADDKGSIKIIINRGHVAISNRCKGLKEEDLNKIFEPYVTFSNTGCNGLGLSIVKAICDFQNLKYSVSMKNSVITFVIDF